MAETVFEEVVGTLNAWKRGFATRKADMNDNQYITHLMKGISDSDDEYYKGLSTPAMKWYKDAVASAESDAGLSENDYPDGFVPKGDAKKAAAKGGKKAAVTKTTVAAKNGADTSPSEKDTSEEAAPEEDGEEHTDEESEEGEAEESNDPRQARIEKLKARAAKVAAQLEKAEKLAQRPARAQGQRGTREESILIRRMIVENPTITPEDLQKEAAARGKTYSLSTIKWTLGSTKIVMQAVKEAGHWAD